LSSGLGGIVVFGGESSTKGGSLIVELGVSLELVGGGLGNGGLGTDTLVKVVNFVNESFFLGSKSGEVSIKSFLLFVEGFN